MNGEDTRHTTVCESADLSVDGRMQRNDGNASTERSGVDNRVELTFG